MAVPHITAASGTFYPCVKNRQESESEILLRVTQPPLDTSEDFQKLHSAHVGTSEIMGHSINKRCLHEAVCTSACYQGALTQDYPVPFPSSEGSWRGLCLLLQVLIILMPRRNSVTKLFLGDCQFYLNSLTEYLQEKQMFLLLWL